jgi:hypothetical protein
MKTFILLAALAIAPLAWAQAPAPKEAAKPAVAKEAAKEPAKADAQKPATVAKKSRRHEDARHCLERGNNIEIIKCAEEYL